MAGDAFDDAHLSLTARAPSGPPPPVALVNTLTELRGYISVINASLLFHIFTEEEQFELGRRLAALLDPRPGSIILGSHGGALRKGQPSGSRDTQMFCHSPESWVQMWEEEIFEKGQVRVNAVLEEAKSVEKGVAIEGAKFYWLVWSIERL